MKKLNTVDFTLYTTDLNDQIGEIHVSRTLNREQKQKALIELGLKPWDLRMLYNGIYFNPHAPIRVVTPSGKTYTFGVEIECFVPRQRIEESARENSVAIQYQGYNHRDTKDYYKFVTDASVRSNNPMEDRNSIECVSPILKGTKGLSSLKSACKALNEAGATVNKNCGLHVHIGAQDLSNKAYVNVFKNYQKLERVIDSFMAPSRRNSTWAESLWSFDFSNCNNPQDVCCTLDNDRYRKVNPCSYSRHNTIEFRQHQGTTNYEKISKWVNFLTKLVEWSETNVLASAVSSISEIPFLNDAEKRYFETRAAEFSNR